MKYEKLCWSNDNEIHNLPRVCIFKGEVLHLTIVIIVPVFGKLKSPCFLFRIIISGHNDIVVTIVTTRDWDQGLELDPDIPPGVESLMACTGVS